jgi:glutathionylspermidine synthase
MVAEPGITLSEPLSRAAFREYRQRAIFEGGKWDVQISDHSALSPRALLVTEPEWRTIAEAASGLARELLAAERELQTALHEGRLAGIDRVARRRLSRLGRSERYEAQRLIRFDFHFCEGHRWMISEANCDVPGGINEAEQFPRIWPDRRPEMASPGQPAEAYVDAIVGTAGEGAVGFVHATAFSDDWQLMKYLADKVEGRGLEPVPLAPDQIGWKDGFASSRGQPLSAIVRFFPGDWLLHTHFAKAWFAAARTPVLNPVISLLTQNKAFALFLRALGIETPAWRTYLPATEAISLAALRSPDRVVKPVYGRVGEGVGIPGVTPRKKLAQSRIRAALHRKHWVAQERFRPSNIGSEREPAYPCIGVYTLGERVIGAYGRVAHKAMIDIDALDAPVFILRDANGGGGHDPGRMLQ